MKRRAPEELEVEREETDDEVAGGGGSSSVFESSSSSYTTKTYGGSGVSTPDIFPEGVSFPSYLAASIIWLILLSSY